MEAAEHSGRTARSARRSESIFYPAFALSTAAAAYFGFYFTYFSPMAAGAYPAHSPFLHIHGWSFFLWYLLFPTQALLIAFGRYGWHVALGRLSLALAGVMIVTGFFVLAVRMDDALAGGGPEFFAFLREIGSLIFSNLLLFAFFYIGAIRMAATGRFEEHKRLMVLASSAGLGAALFRIFVNAFGVGSWADTGWVLAINVFMLAAMLYDRLAYGRVHPIYWKGFAIAVIVEALLWPFAANPIVPAVNSTLAAIGEQIRFLY